MNGHLGLYTVSDFWDQAYVWKKDTKFQKVQRMWEEAYEVPESVEKAGMQVTT
jgi:hypothetical protein